MQWWQIHFAFFQTLEFTNQVMIIALVNSLGPLFCRKVWAFSVWPMSISMASERLDWLKRTRSSKSLAVDRSRWAAAFIGANRRFCSAPKNAEFSRSILAAFNWKY